MVGLLGGRWAAVVRGEGVCVEGVYPKRVFGGHGEVSEEVGVDVEGTSVQGK